LSLLLSLEVEEDIVKGGCMTGFFRSACDFFLEKRIVLAGFLEKALVLNICSFVLFSPFSAVFSKISFFWSSLFWISLNIVQYRSKFYRYLIPSTTLNKSLAVFLAVALASVLFSVDPYHSQKIFFQRYLFYVIFFWITYGVTSRSRQNFLYLTFSILALATIVGAGGLFDHFRLAPERLFSVFGQQINLAVYLCFLFPFSLVVFLNQEKKFFKLWGLVNIVLLYPVLVFHASRTVWIVIIPVALLICFLKDRRSFFFFLAVVIATPAFMSSLQKERAKTVLDVFPALASYESQGTADQPAVHPRIESLHQRIDLANSAFAMFKKQPLLGAGPGMFEKLHKPGPGCDPHIHTHVIYLEILSEMGLAGLLAFFMIITMFLKKFFNDFLSWLRKGSLEYSIFAGLGSAIFIVLLCNLGISSILVGFQDAAMFWLFMAMGINEKVLGRE